MNIMKSSLAELIGTFTLVFIGAGAGALDSGGLLGVALAHGVALLVIIYAWGSISGAHVNPAVTLGIALTGRMPWPKAIAYWVAQFIGAVIAAYLLKYLIGTTTESLGATVGQLTKADPLRTVLIEAVLTYFLVTAVFASGVHGRNGNLAGVAIGLVLTMDILAGGPLTGASMNPARTFGPALALGDLSYVHLYLIGPLAGGAVGALVYEWVFLPAELQPPVKAAEEKNRRR